LNFDFYENLAKCYSQLGKTKEQLAKYQSQTDNNPVARVMIGLLHEQNGNKKQAITTLDDFVTSEPDLIITPAVRKHIKDLVDGLDS
jgi:lipopolysaccharide biosynthesis regulator YciM